MTEWLDAEEAELWQSFVVSTLRLFGELEAGLSAAGDINHLDYGMLAQLSFRDDRRMRMAELADLFGEPRTVISYRINRLEKRGIVHRERDPADGRGVYALLTEAGATLLERLAPGHVDRVRSMFIDQLDAAERQQLARVFERLRSSQPHDH